MLVCAVGIGNYFFDSGYWFRFVFRFVNIIPAIHEFIYYNVKKSFRWYREGFFIFMKATYKERWKPLLFCNGKYKISNHGKVLSVYTMSKLGEIKLTGTILKTTINKKGYEKVRISWYENGKYFKKTMAVHRLVGMAFIPNTENKPEINHLDFNTINNHVNNLEWATPLENMAHYYASEKFKNRQKKSGKFSEEEVRYLREMFTRIPVKKLAKMFGEPYGVIYDIVTYQKYNFDNKEVEKIGRTSWKEIINIETNIISESAQALSLEIGVSVANIRRQLNGERYCHIPYRYIVDGIIQSGKIKLPPPPKPPKVKAPKKERPPRKVYIPHPAVYRKMIMMDKAGNELQVFNSSGEAAKYVNSNADTFRKAIKNSPNNFTKGYYWKYA